MDQLNLIADNIKLLVDATNRPLPFWNTQWFSALIGAVSALVISWIIDKISARRDRLWKLYDDISKRIIWLNVEKYFLDVANCTSYSGSEIRNGVTINRPEMTVSEKMVIELRRKYKYWNYPMGRLRFLFKKYEVAINKISNSSNIKESKEYKRGGPSF